MALGNFFKINFPYGIESNRKGEWLAFNREYEPFGFNSVEIYNYEDFPLFTKYEKIDVDKIVRIIRDDVSNISIDNEGNINKIFFYNDRTSPSTNPEYCDDYIKIIKELSVLKIERYR